MSGPSEFEQLRRKFVKIGCEVDKPGFCNDQPFMDAERVQATLLEDYGRYVLGRSVSAPDRVDVVVRRTADYLFERLRRSSKLGACVDASCVLSEFLTRQGVWSFVVSGGTTVIPHNKANPPMRMQPIMAPGNPAKAGHAWVVAPPFKIIDLTISLQPYSKAIKLVMPPEYVLATDPRPGQEDVDDFIEAEAMPYVLQQLKRPPTLRDVYTVIQPSVAPCVKSFGVHQVEFGPFDIRYISCGIGGMDKPLERWRNLQLDGLWPGDLYSRFRDEVG